MVAPRTAAAITPVRKVIHEDRVLYENPGEQPGEVALSLRQQLWDIQYGVIEDKHNWCHIVSEGCAAVAT